MTKNKRCPTHYPPPPIVDKTMLALSSARMHAAQHCPPHCALKKLQNIQIFKHTSGLPLQSQQAAVCQQKLLSVPDYR